MHKGRYRIVIRMHAFRRALQRKIDPDFIEETIMTGVMERFGKNFVRFVKKYRKFKIECIDEIIGNVIFIVTITKTRH